jgi:nitrogen fixation-related uncharacterized protein
MHSTSSVVAVLAFVAILAYWWGYSQGRQDVD